MKSLVAYFSASGTTRKLAGKLAEAVGADLFEIEPAELYTREDLDWRDKTSRSTLEMNDRSARPRIASVKEDMDSYDLIFVGFPIWWYREPSVIDTFLEQYDFTGKTLVPVATSGGSGMGETSRNFRAMCAGKIEDGKRFSGAESEEVIKEWAEKYL